MPSITIRNIPENLQKKLKKRSKINRRSLNSEILACLEEFLLPQKPDVDKLLEKSGEIRNSLAFEVREKDIDYAVKSGRK